MSYSPGVVPDDAKDLPEFLRIELDKIKRTLDIAKDSTDRTILHAAPKKVRAGQEVNADGTDWNPGSGAGVYRRNGANSAWVFIG